VGLIDWTPALSLAFLVISVKTEINENQTTNDASFPACACFCFLEHFLPFALRNQKRSVSVSTAQTFFDA
jgi:hypothetical protein